MKWLLLLVLLLPQEDKLDKAIKNLDSDDIAVRQTASDDLLGAGAAAIKPLKKFLENPTSVESKARAEGIVVRIERKVRWDGLKSGPVVGWLQGYLKVEREAYLEGEEIKLTFEVANIGRESTDFIPATGFDHEYPGESAHETSSHAVVKVVKVPADPPGEMRCIQGCGVGPDMTSVKLGSYESRVHETKFKREKLGLGDYDVTIVYYSKDRALVAGAESNLATNTARFKIVAELPKK